LNDPVPSRTRFAPSPTGRFHIGGARTALYSYLIAKQGGGQFVLRIEDTDRRRLVPSAEAEIMESLRWLGIEWDEGPDIGGPYGPYRQSERAQIYRRYAQDLVDQGDAYPCFCSPERLARVRKEMRQRRLPPRYDGQCRRISPADAQRRVEAGESHVIRFKTPGEGSTTAVDALRGPIKVENETLDDYILLKSDGMPVYHLGVVVDDHLMKITHVVRTAEWLPTFPLHVLLYQAFGWPQPEWIHPSVFLNPSGKGKLSKRDSGGAKGGVGAIFTLDLREMGYLPEAVLNWMALMGWAYDDHTELFSLVDLIEKFSVGGLNPSPAAVNYSKLDHFNGLYIRSLETSDLAGRMEPFFIEAGIPADRERLERIAPIIQERIRTLDEAVDMAGFFFREEIEPDPEALVGKKMSPGESAQALRRAHEVIAALPSMEIEPLESALRDLAEEMGLKAGQLFGILRMAVTGQRVSPPLIESMEIVGQGKVLERIAHAAEVMEGWEGSGTA
jgi:glutamyl-tRNA synthetase